MVGFGGGKTAKGLEDVKGSPEIDTNNLEMEIGIQLIPKRLYGITHSIIEVEEDWTRARFLTGFQFQ